MPHNAARSALGFGVLACSLAAQPVAAQATNSEPQSIYDRIWKFTEWYKDDSNPVIQGVWFTGRYQHDYAALKAEEGSATEWNVRRMRLGARIALFRAWTVHGEAELNPQERDPLYVRFTDLYVQWRRDARLAVTVGKQSVPFTADGATSSKELLTIDRSNLTNNLWFPQEYIPGVALSGRFAPWAYRAGVYSAGAADREFGDFQGGVFTLTSLGYDFANPLGVKEALLTGSYVYQQPDSRNTFTRPLGHVFSAALKVETSAWGVRADFSRGSGYLGQSDLSGAMVMPFLNVTKRLQTAARYTRLESDQPDGVRLATYESRIVSGRGNRYSEWYLGANYYVYGHKLKLQTGVQHADLTGRGGNGGRYSGWSWTSGLRVGW